MKVGVVAQKLSFAGDFRETGVSRYIEHLLRNLPCALAEDDQILAMAGPDARVGVESGWLPDSLEWHWTRWPTARVPVRVLWEQLAAPVVARQADLDLIHGPLNAVPLLGRVPSVVTIHDLAFLAFPEQYPGSQRRYLTMMTSASARKSCRVITVSEYTGRDVVERLGIPAERITSVPNGVAQNYFPRDGTTKLAAFRVENGLPEAFLLFVGTLQPRKNLIGLLRAYGILEQHERVPLYVVGSPGWMYADIYGEVSRLGLTRDVHFPGYASSDSLPLWYSAATAFIYPSYYEGFGLPVLEAMACGTPVVTSGVSSLPEVAGDAALLVDPADTEEIAEAIRTVLRNEKLRYDLAQRGMTRAAMFSWQRTARETAAVYREVLDGG